MTSRSKEKFTAAFRKLFRSSEKIGDGEGAAGGPSGSPARRGILRHGYHRDGVRPVEGAASMPASPAAAAFGKQKGAEAPPPPKSVRARRLMKEFKEMQRLQQSRPDPIFTVELVNDNLFEWHVRLHRVDPESELAGDLKELRIPCVLLHLTFPENFPFAPPFMRVIEPRIEKGFVMEGGAICMELLTPRGWASAYTVEAVLMQFAASLVKGHGRVSRKAKGSKDFNKRTAEESFRSLVKTHEKYGWVTPALSDG
ncbi:ubiquitin-conjugating enzyme E2Q-like protein 1 isoform X2 [Arctopsyche grandis]